MMIKNQEEQILESRHPATMTAQALGWIDEQTKALIPPVHPATTFIRDPDNQYRAGYSYGRPTNPTFVQPEALLTAAERGLFAFAALDVLPWPEPWPDDMPLWNVRNVLVMPHLAGVSRERAARNWELILENAGRFHRGEPLLSVVDMAAGY